MAVNAWDEDEATLRRFARRENLKHRILPNGNAVYQDYGKPGLPFTVWIKPDGRAHGMELGFDGAKPLEKKTAELLLASS